MGNYFDPDDDEGFDESPTLEALEDAIVEDTVHCSKCGASLHISETFSIGGLSVCMECAQDEIDLVVKRLEDVQAENDRLRVRLGRVVSTMPGPGRE